MRRRTRLISTGALALGILFSTTAPASADHHFVSIREVFPGSTLKGATSEFVELQAYAAGQTNYEGTMMMPNVLRFYDAGGGGPVTFGVGPDVANGANQASALYATSPEAEMDFGVTADFPAAPLDLMNPAGGAVCFHSGTFGSIDCVAWGSFDNSTLMLPVGATLPPAIPDESSLGRSIAPGCPTLLEAGDDTNNSATDFAAATPSPRNNAGAITETACTPPVGTFPPGNPTSPINPAGHVRKRKCKKKQKSAAAAKKKKCKKR